MSRRISRRSRAISRAPSRNSWRAPQRLASAGTGATGATASIVPTRTVRCSSNVGVFIARSSLAAARGLHRRAEVRDVARAILLVDRHARAGAERRRVEERAVAAEEAYEARVGPEHLAVVRGALGLRY